MCELQTRLKKMYIDDLTASIITACYGKFDGITANYPLTMVNYEMVNGVKKRLIIPRFESRYVFAYERLNSDATFIINTPINRKLPKNLSVLKLLDLIKGDKIKSKSLDFLNNSIAIYDGLQWIGLFKDALKRNDYIESYEILSCAISCDMITKTGQIINPAHKFSDYLTVNELVGALGINPREFKTILSELCDYSQRQLVDGYSVREITDSEEVDAIYARSSHDDNFTSCMRGYHTPARIYADYLPSKCSVSLFVLEKNGEFIARFVARLKTKKYATVYTNENDSNTIKILSLLGFERNPSCMVGARLPLKTASNNAIYMPYIDGDNKSVRLVESDNGQYLQIGGVAGIEIGTANGTQGFLKVNRDGIDAGFSSLYGDDVSENYDSVFTCDCCGNQYDVDDLRTLENGNVYCEECYNDNVSWCEECESECDSDSTIYVSVYDFRRSRSEELTLCTCCQSDFFISPTDDTAFRISDIN